MRRQFAAWIAVLGLVVSACTSSADADVESDLSALAARTPVSTQEAAVSRLIENFFSALQQRNHYALYAMFTPDDQCRPGRIETLLANVTPGIAETSEVEVDDISLRRVGATYSVAFTLIEHQGASEKELVYDGFFPIEETFTRWRFSANLCEWLSAPAGQGSAGIQQELATAIAAMQTFYQEHATYLASGNDLRYHASGLNVTMDELSLMPGDVLVVPGDQQALLLGQGIEGGWYCVAFDTGADPLFGSGGAFEDVAFYDSCVEGGSTGGW